MIALNAFDTKTIRMVGDTTHRLRSLSSLVDRMADGLVPQAKAEADCEYTCYCGSDLLCTDRYGYGCDWVKAKATRYCSDEAGHCTGIICYCHLKCSAEIYALCL